MNFEGRFSNGSGASSPSRGEGMSTYSPSIRTKSVEDGELYLAGQALVPVVNNPAGLHRNYSGSYGILSWPASAVDRAWAEATVPPPSSSCREVVWADFDEYRLKVASHMDRYLYKRMSVQQDNARRLSVMDPEGCGYLRGEGLVQALRQVPSLFFQEDFSLTRPETFSQVIRGETPEERNTTLETLNSSLDIVETELLNEIAARSDSFFEAAESLQDLQQSMGNTLFQIQRLQINACNIDAGMCSRAEQIQSLHRKRKNLEATLEILRTVEAVTHAQDAVNLLLLAHDYPSALDLIDDLKQQYEDDTPSETVFSKLRCLKHMPDMLDASVVSLRACLVGELLELMNWDEGESVLRSVAAKALGEEGRVGTPLRGPTDNDQRAKLEKMKQILMGLSRTGTLSGTFAEIIPHAVSRLSASLRNVMEILVPNFVHVATNDNESMQDGSRSEHLHWITHEMFLVLLNACYSVAAACIAHYSSLGELLLEAADDGTVIPHRPTIERGRTDLCQALVDACHSQWAQLFQSRMHIHQQLPLNQLQELMDVNDQCNDLAARVNVRSTQKLGLMLQTLCKSALETLHTRNLNTLHDVLQQENWKVCIVDPAVEESIRQAFFPDEHLSPTDEEKCQMLYLGDVGYKVVPAVLILASMICDAVLHNKTFPDLVTDTGRHVIELITVFNKRSCQLVLGAQAMQVSGLKSITAKHLALCSQSVLFFIDLHQRVYSSILDECPQVKRTILQPEFDRLKQDLLMHLNGIHSKLVGIMKERLQVGIQQLREEVRCPKEIPPDEMQSPTNASQQIAKQLRILTQVLTPILHEQQMTEICSNVAEIFGEDLGMAFQEMIDEYDILIDPSTEQYAQPEELRHPLDGIEDPKLQPTPKTEAEMKMIVNQRRQLTADCSFLISVLSKLPTSIEMETLLGPLNGIAQVLDCQMSPSSTNP